MGKRNLTGQLGEDVITRAKVIAAKRGTSISGLVARELEGLVAEEERYEASWRRAREIMSTSPARGGRSWRRDEISLR